MDSERISSLRALRSWREISVVHFAPTSQDVSKPNGGAGCPIGLDCGCANGQLPQGAQAGDQAAESCRGGLFLKRAVGDP